jgi:hypothetical protein
LCRVFLRRAGPKQDFANTGQVGAGFDSSFGVPFSAKQTNEKPSRHANGKEQRCEQTGYPVCKSTVVFPKESQYT